MIKLKIFLIILCLILGGIIIWKIFVCKKDKYNVKKKEKIKEEIKFEGLVLFDIDGTLTTGKENYKVVQYFLDKGYAVGVTTAGSIYTPENISKFEWMPNNLLNFLIMNQYNTFNNVVNKILCGVYRPDLYDLHMHNIPSNAQISNYYGWAKALTLKESGYKYGIIDESKLILIDNDPGFIEGVKMYNKKMITIPGGLPASNETLNLENIINYFN